MYDIRQALCVWLRTDDWWVGVCCAREAFVLMPSDFLDRKMGSPAELYLVIDNLRSGVVYNFEGVCLSVWR